SRRRHRVRHEPLDPGRREVRRVAGGSPRLPEHAQPERPARGLLHPLALAQPHLDLQRLAPPHQRRRPIGAGAPRPLGDLLGDSWQLHASIAGVHLRPCDPPAVMAAIFAVGVRTPTGTDWPSLPQVHMPSDRAKSLRTAVTLVRTSGPLPIRLTSLSGAVSLPSSIR